MMSPLHCNTIDINLETPSRRNPIFESQWMILKIPVFLRQWHDKIFIIDQFHAWNYFQEMIRSIGVQMIAYFASSQHVGWKPRSNFTLICAFGRSNIFAARCRMCRGLWAGDSCPTVSSPQIKSNPSKPGLILRLCVSCFDCHGTAERDIEQEMAVRLQSKQKTFNSPN